MITIPNGFEQGELVDRLAKDAQRLAEMGVPMPMIDAASQRQGDRQMQQPAVAPRAGAL